VTRCLQHKREYHFPPVLFCPGYNFNSLLLSYTKTANITALRSDFATKNSPKCVCGRSSASDPARRCSQTYSNLGEPFPMPPSSTPSVFQFSASLAPRLWDPRCQYGNYYQKSAAKTKRSTTTTTTTFIYQS